MSLQPLKESIEYLRKNVSKDLAFQQIHILLAVAEREGITMHDLSTELGLPHGSISRNIKALCMFFKEDASGEEQLTGYGLLETRQDRFKRKRLAVYVTPDGRKVLEGLDKVLNRSLAGKGSQGGCPCKRLGGTVCPFSRWP